MADKKKIEQQERIERAKESFKVDDSEPGGTYGCEHLVLIEGDFIKVDTDK